jgi:hypothetical protein
MIGRQCPFAFIGSPVLLVPWYVGPADRLPSLYAGVRVPSLRIVGRVIGFYDFAPVGRVKLEGGYSRLVLLSRLQFDEFYFKRPKN